MLISEFPIWVIVHSGYSKQNREIWEEEQVGGKRMCQILDFLTLSDGRCSAEMTRRDTGLGEKFRVEVLLCKPRVSGLT